MVASSAFALAQSDREHLHQATAQGTTEVRMLLDTVKYDDPIRLRG